MRCIISMELGYTHHEDCLVALVEFSSTFADDIKGPVRLPAVWGLENECQLKLFVLLFHTSEKIVYAAQLVEFFVVIEHIMANGRITFLFAPPLDSPSSPLNSCFPFLCMLAIFCAPPIMCHTFLMAVRKY